MGDSKFFFFSVEIFERSKKLQNSLPECLKKIRNIINISWFCVAKEKKKWAYDMGIIVNDINNTHKKNWTTKKMKHSQIKISFHSIKGLVRKYTMTKRYGKCWLSINSYIVKYRGLAFQRGYMKIKLFSLYFTFSFDKNERFYYNYPKV